MTLAQYLIKNGMTETAFAQLLGVSQVTINRYVKEQRFPDKAMILRISEATNEDVAPADWYIPTEAAE